MKNHTLLSGGHANVEVFTFLNSCVKGDRLTKQHNLTCSKEAWGVQS